MTKEPSLVRASDIGQWSYCQRAWWLAHVRKAQHQAPARLRQGEQIHVAHGRTLTYARLLRRVGIVLLALALLLCGFGIALWLLV